jgi:glycosyltransferase involved in cell wall biosynthesis
MLSPRAPAEVARVMNALDALVLLSHTTRTWKEQFGRVIMEAQACGIPVIGSDSGSIPNVVGPGGWIVPEGNVSALAALLAHLASAPEEVARAGAAGYEQAQTRYSVAKVANDLADAYQGAAAARRAFFSPSNALPGATTSPPAAPSGT